MRFRFSASQQIFDILYALDKGIHLIEEVGDRPFSSAALTAEWEGKLQEVEKGKRSFRV